MTEFQSITSAQAPVPVGPYSQAIKFGQVIYTSGQIPIDPATGKLIGSDIKEQTRLVLQNLHNVLSAAGSGLDQVVKTTIFLTKMSDFKDVNEVYQDFFTAPFPARSTIAVKELPLGADVEIEVVASGA